MFLHMDVQLCKQHCDLCHNLGNYIFVGLKFGLYAVPLVYLFFALFLINQVLCHLDRDLML